MPRNTMKTCTKLLALLLSALMLFSVVACASTGDGNETTVPVETTANQGNQGGDADETTLGGGTEAEETVMHDVPADYKINDEVSVLYWSDVEMTEFEVEDITGDTVGDEIYWRNKYTEGALGITLKWYGTPGNNGNRNNFANFVQASYEASDRTYDIIASYSRTMGILSTKGYLADLNAIDGSFINTEKPWWPENLVQTVTIGDAMYFISGDISTNTLYFMYGIFCNTNMQKNLNLEDPITMVNNGSWTLPNWIAMCDNVYADTDADGAKTEGDTYGFTSYYLHTDMFYIGSDLKLIEKDDVDMLVISPDFSSQKTYDLFDTLQEFYFGPDNLNTKNCDVIFMEERALFTHNRLYFADRKLKDSTFVYTILPCPKYNEEQATYLTCVGNPMTLWGLMSDAKEEEKTAYSAVMEVMAYYAYKHTSPAIFEVNYKSKYSETDEASKMFDIIRSSVRHDLGRILNTDLVGCTMTQEFAGAIWNQESWASIIGTWKRTITKKLEKVVDSYMDLKD